MQKKITYPDVTIVYDVEGSGFPVVLVHGFGEDRRVWDEQIPHLKNFCQLIVPDLPGSGDSVTGNESTADTIGYYADCINAVLTRENINTCIMLGHSMGGYITLSFAEKYREKLTAFGLIHSTAFADSEEKKENRRKGIELIEKYGAYAFLKTTTPNLFAETYKENNPGKIESLIKKGNNFSRKSLQRYYTAMMNRPDRTHILKNSTLPVLFITGTDDVAAPLKDVLQQVYMPERSYVHILEQTGHMGMWESPERVNTGIAEFIKEST